MAYDIDVTCEPIDVTTVYPTYKIDPAWEHTDAAGHRHAVCEGKTPTLKTIREEGVCPDCGTEIDRVRTVCRVCGQEVEPAMIVDKPASGWREYAAGPRRITFTRISEGMRRVFEPPDGDAANALLAAQAFAWPEGGLVALIEADGWIEVSCRTEPI